PGRVAAPGGRPRGGGDPRGRHGRARGGAGMTPALLLGIPLGLPWIVGAVLALLDGRRRAVGIFAIAGLGLSFAALIGLGLTVRQGGPVSMVAGGWPAGIGISFRADGLGVVFAIVS